MTRIQIITTVLAALLAAGCAGDSAFPEATGKGTVRAINTIASSPAITLLIEERIVGAADYKSATAAIEYDDLEYTFNVETALSTGRERVASRDLDVVADTDYTFVISGALANPTITIAETDVRTFAESDTVFELRFGHFGATLGDVDVYLDAPGVAPALGQQEVTLSVGDITDPLDYPEGDYVLIYTAAGDPGTVLFTSDTIALLPRIASIMGVFDADPDELGQIAVRLFNADGGDLSISDVNFAPTVRLHHASMALATADVYNEDPAMFPPIVTDHAFADVTGDIPGLVGLNALTYTDAGDTGTILFESELFLPAGSRTEYYVVGETGALAAVAVLSDRRPIETIAKFSFFHAASNHDSIDLYIVDADTDIADQSPLLFGVPPGTPPVRSSLQDGSFDLYMTVAGEKTVIAGPVRVDAALGDIIDAVAYDNVDPAIADLVLVPLP